jgi:hypothetical protein
MTDQQIENVCAWLSQGAKVYVAQHYSGRRRIKIMRGPFGLKTERFHCREEDLMRLNARIRETRILN